MMITDVDQEVQAGSGVAVLFDMRNFGDASVEINLVGDTKKKKQNVSVTRRKITEMIDGSTRLLQQDSMTYH